MILKSYSAILTVCANLTASITRSLRERPHTGSEKADILAGIKLRNDNLLNLLREKWAAERADK
jgi:hypothetical protein